MNLGARKPVFGGLQTTKTKTSQSIRLFAYWKVSYQNLLQAKFHYSSYSLKLSRLVLISPNAPISPRIILVPRVPDQYFWLIGCISAKQSGTYGQSRTITWEGLERSGTIASVLRESGTKKVIRYCF